MAGIIFSFGENSSCYFRKVKQSFKNLKGLQTSYEIEDRDYQLAKFRRAKDKGALNVFVNGNISVFAIGSLYYGVHKNTNAVEAIGKDVKKRRGVELIAKDTDGHFCVVIIDSKECKAYIITDIGAINIYSYEEKNLFFLSTSMLSLAQVFLMTPSVGDILLFLRSGKYFDSTTCFEEISVLEPSTIYKIDLTNGRKTAKKYWQVPIEVNEDIGFVEAAKKIKCSLDQIVDGLPVERTIYDFTGGYDARFVLALAYGKERIKNSINAFFFGPRTSREARIVQENCENLGIIYNNFHLPDTWPSQFYDYVLESHALCDGMENACVYAPILWVQKKKGENFTFSVTGLFGELYRQRRWITEFGKRGQKRPPDLRKLIRYRDLADDFDTSIFSNEYRPFMRDIPNKLLKIYTATNKIFDYGAPNTLLLDNIYFSQTMRRWGGRNLSTTNQLIQCVSPLWFKKPLSISLSLPPNYRKRNKLMRHIVEETSGIFGKQRTINSSPFTVMHFNNIHLFLPATIFFARIGMRKIGQVMFNKTIWADLTTPAYDTSRWYRKALRDTRCVNLLDFEQMILSKVFERQRFKKFIDKARSNNFHFFGQLGNIITMELTLRSAFLKKGVDLF